MCDSYNETSKKSGEWLRRGGADAIRLSSLEESTPLPKQMDKFWKCPDNKIDLQLLSRARAISESDDIVVSGIVRIQELMAARVNGKIRHRRT